MSRQLQRHHPAIFQFWILRNELTLEFHRRFNGADHYSRCRSLRKGSYATESFMHAQAGKQPQYYRTYRPGNV